MTVRACLLTLLLAPLGLAEGTAPWVSVSPAGKLVYAADAKGNTIPDFSNCGYHGGGVALPKDVAVKATVSPEPGSKDDTARIQAAIDGVYSRSATADGQRGAGLL